MINTLGLSRLNNLFGPLQTSPAEVMVGYVPLQGARVNDVGSQQPPVPAPETRAARMSKAGSGQDRAAGRRHGHANRPGRTDDFFRVFSRLSWLIILKLCPSKY